ncbi:MAG: hypothetical protein NVSMB44_27840 [Ktedonobacteraceae bacterium]
MVALVRAWHIARSLRGPCVASLIVVAVCLAWHYTDRYAQHVQSMQRCEEQRHYQGLLTSLLDFQHTDFQHTYSPEQEP